MALVARRLCGLPDRGLALGCSCSGAASGQAASPYTSGGHVVSSSGDSVVMRRQSESALLSRNKLEKFIVRPKNSRFALPASSVRSQQALDYESPSTSYGSSSTSSSSKNWKPWRLGTDNLSGRLEDGPSCVYVGSIENADQSTLEALYMQAREAYYGGQPLISDAMFDNVERRLRWFRSKVVLKYPRCSLKKYSAYSDAEVDDQQLWALAYVWAALLAVGCALAAGPPICLLSSACREVVDGVRYHGQAPVMPVLSPVNTAAVIAMGMVVGVPLVTQGVKSLKGMFKGDLVALKGNCPSCGEEVYAFMRTDEGVKPRHKAECHVCEHPIAFHITLENASPPGKQKWAYGRVYLVSSVEDLAPRS